MDKRNDDMKKKSKQTRISQNTCPQHTIEDALIIPQTIKNEFGGHPTDPMLLSGACGYSPASSLWRSLTGAAVAYGLTDGGYNSKEIGIAAIGERIVSPTIEGDEKVAICEAVLRPTILNEFFSRYDRNKFPREDICKNVLLKMGVPQARIESVYNIICSNGRLANIIQIISGSEYVRIENMHAEEPLHKENIGETVVEQRLINDDRVEEIPIELAERMGLDVPKSESKEAVRVTTAIPRVFISHGKESKTIITQIKELLTYGQMEPVVSIENEALAISVPDKVFDDMRSCQAGIIHICPEKIDSEDRSIKKLNENVLIEIGAAMALYGNKIIILCKRNTELPSNLQGLYRCEYEGEQLDYSSTMKLLKTLQELRAKMN